ncbi:MAG: aminoglycoside phosphotransferase family protein [candidate division KSB1 bacterium]|nr:aminoglycoside phosphotransferase family protein [candidate division KSB1 bacterium]MDZ7302412.1 aminoglycoside phosphotransferase family protein [candidate division KSB1 bacterium]MDZ7311614.1 aminoglycoside phosphotransferase family protein [candidate division KSB1 bacterium]
MAKIENLPDHCEFPQLREIMNAKKLAETLQRHLAPSAGAEQIQVEACKIDQLYYKPEESCRILFTADFRPKNRHEISRQIYFAKIFHSHRKDEVVESCNPKNFIPPEVGPAVIHIPEWEMVVWAYPNDPNLPGLALMVDPEKVLVRAQAAPEQFGLPHPPTAITAERTKYVPGKRCGYIYRMTLATSNAQPANSSSAVYAKAYHHSEGENAYAIMKQIWESPACQSGEFIIPQPYSYDRENHILWQEALSGQPFADIAGEINNLPEVANEIGRRLAAFHNTRLHLPEQMTFDFQVEEVRTAVAAITEMFPRHAESTQAVGQKLLAAAAQLGPGPVTPLHASFKFSHIFVTAKGIAFIDFDGANLGDPGYDLGRFIAHLYKMVANWKIDPEVSERAVANFCQSYNRAATSTLPPERIDWFAAAHLVSSQVYKSVKRMDTTAVKKLLKIADRLCPA